MNDEIKLHYDDISIVPEIVTNIYTRKECNPYCRDGMLPIFASPMGSVLNEHNWMTFYDNKINTVIPRTVSLDERLRLLFQTMMPDQKYHPFIAFSLSEAENEVLNHKHIVPVELYEYNRYFKICIDLANGHMNKLLWLIKKFKQKFGKHVIIMAGNIANPATYTEYELAGCDYVRVSIGTGSACLTASNTGIYYPPFSLLKDIYDIRKQYHGRCKVIADGGIKGFRDIQKALIYADYVMIGGLFNKCIESSGKTTYGRSWIKIGNHKIRNYLVDMFRKGKEISPEDYDKVMTKIKDGTLEVNKHFYGMSTKFAQQEINGLAETKTSEGLVKSNTVEYSISQWVENEECYLRSAMSYTNSITLDDYKESLWIRLSNITYNK